MGKISEDFPKVWKHYKENGRAFVTARLVVSNITSRLLGVKLSEIADTTELFDLITDLKSAIESNDSETFRNLIKEIESLATFNHLNKCWIYN